MLSPTEMVLRLAQQQFFVKENIANRKRQMSPYSHVVLQRSDKEGDPCVCVGMFRTEGDAETFADVKRKQFVAQATGKRIEITIV